MRALAFTIFTVPPSFGEKENYFKNWDFPCFHRFFRKLKLKLLLSLITAFGFRLLGVFITYKCGCTSIRMQTFLPYLFLFTFLYDARFSYAAAIEVLLQVTLGPTVNCKWTPEGLWSRYLLPIDPEHR